MTPSSALLSPLLWLIALVMVPLPAWSETAEDNYRLYCIQCHGSLGNGEGINQTAGGLNVSPRNHALAEEMAKLTDEELRLAIREGGDAVQKSELMPAFGKTISAQEIDALVLHLRKLCQCEANR
jgi:cytochrome c oxidase cbb3-type subunit 3